MSLYESVSSYMIVLVIYMMVYGCTCAHMDVYESIWWYMNVNGSKWEYMKVYEVLWWYIIAYDNVWM